MENQSILKKVGTVFVLGTVAALATINLY